MGQLENSETLLSTIYVFMIPTKFIFKNMQYTDGCYKQMNYTKVKLTDL